MRAYAKYKTGSTFTLLPDFYLFLTDSIANAPSKAKYAVQMMFAHEI